MTATIKHVTLKSLGKNKDIDPSKGTVTNPFTQEEYNSLCNTGEWTGGYVEGTGYVMISDIYNMSELSGMSEDISGELENFLKSLTAFAADCFLHYINEKGDMELPDEQWTKIQKIVGSIDPSKNTKYIKKEGNKTYYVMSYSFYKTEFENALGTATLTFNSNGTLIGLYDLYDFNLVGAKRKLSSHALTFLGGLFSGKSYHITKGKYFILT
ncbi:MAG: hypothetical protein IJ139_06015 [Bacteroidaceae bacterium]|nr:hypothetical protein [Bacteroidaceae bacterium]